MGNYKFRFSDMIPNAWFYKLKDMNTKNTKNHHHPKSLNKKHSQSSSSSAAAAAVSDKPHLSEQRKSYHFTRDFSFQPIHKTEHSPVKPPRKSSTRRNRNRRRPPPPPPRIISAGCTCRATVESVWLKPDPDNSSSPYSSDLDSVLTEYGSCSDSCKFRSQNDVVFETIHDFDNNLPPIITTKNEATKIERTSTEISERNKYGSLSVKVVKENFVNSASPARRFSSPGVRLRPNSPRIGNRRVQGPRRSLSSNSSSGSGGVSESVAVVKSSKDPWRDFRESMVEMIVENNIRASKDLEELLACYLSLNSDEYHDLIVNVFKQIWFDFIHLRLK